MAAGRKDFSNLGFACLQDPRDRAPRLCRMGPPGPPEVLLWGDSHAAAISEGVASGLGRPALFFVNAGCPPTLGSANAGVDRDCVALNAQAKRLVEIDRNIKIVVLSAYWNLRKREGGALFWPSVQQLVDQLNASGKQVIVVAGIPEPAVDVPWTSAVRESLGRPPLRLVCPPARVPLDGITLVDVSAEFCRKPVYLLFSDANHPSRFAGLKIIAPMIRRASQIRE
ncbi:MAG: SGNH hydrolase domain-containing protein [Sphingomicrobium sp.]